MALTGAVLRSAAQTAAATFRGSEEELNAADAKLGDGDTGLMLRRLFATVETALAEDAPDLGSAMMAVAKACASATGSSLGTLVTISAMTLAKAWKGRADLPWSELAPALRAVRDAMMARGGAALGDKTVIDALDAVATAIEGCEDGSEIAAKAAAAAQHTLDRFRDRPNRIGRARMFAERSIGLDDPGMLAFAKLAAALARHQGGPRAA